MHLARKVQSFEQIIFRRQGARVLGLYHAPLGVLRPYPYSLDCSGLRRLQGAWLGLRL